MTRMLPAVALALALHGTPALTAQEPAPPAVERPTEAVAPAASGAAGGAPLSGLPRRAPDPRTLREYWPVFLGFSLTWLGIVGYLLSVGRRFGRTARALAVLDETRSVP